MPSFDYHYAHFKCAGAALSKPLDPKEFARIDAIREASITAIALEAGIIEKIPENGRLTSQDFQTTMVLIRRYEIGQSEVAA